MARINNSQKELIYYTYYELIEEVRELKDELLSNSFPYAHGKILSMINERLDMKSDMAEKLTIRLMLLIDPEAR